MGRHCGRARHLVASGLQREPTTHRSCCDETNQNKCARRRPTWPFFGASPSKKPRLGRSLSGVELCSKACTAQWWLVAINPSGETNDAKHPLRLTVAPRRCRLAWQVQTDQRGGPCGEGFLLGRGSVPVATSHLGSLRRCTRVGREPVLAPRRTTAWQLPPRVEIWLRSNRTRGLETSKGALPRAPSTTLPRHPNALAC